MNPLPPSNTIPTDTPALISWLESEELSALNKADKHKGFTKGLEHQVEARAYRKVITKIQNGRLNQRPHVMK